MGININLVDEKPVTGIELIAAALIFVLPLFSFLEIFQFDFPNWVDIVTVFVIWGAVILTLVLALIKRLPRWSLPYLGFLLMVGMVFAEYYRLWMWIYPLFLDIFGPRAGWALSTRVVYAGVSETFSWLTLFLSAVILVNLLRLIPFTRGVWQRIRTDWTELSFLLYGALVFYIMLTYDEYRQEEIWKFAAWLCLAVGAWFYLRGETQKQRIWALAGGATAALWITTLAKWLLVPLQEWPTGWPVAPNEASRWVETSYTFMSWGGFMVVMFAPALLDLLPRSQSVPEKEA
jgi:hypothetical protein